MATTVTASWMYGDSGAWLLGQAVARVNPLRWSRSTGLREVIAELEKLRDQTRPVRIVIRNRQEDTGLHKRSRTKVAQRFASVAGAVASLNALCEQMPEAAGPSPSSFPSTLQPPATTRIRSISAESAAPDLDGAESFFTIDGEEEPEFASCATLAGPGEPAGAHPSPLDVLRAHLSTGSPVLARWMWGDAGLSAVLPRYTVLAESNPWRWSRAMSLEETIASLDCYILSKHAERPVRLRLWSSSLREGEEGEEDETKCVHFHTTAHNVAFAGSIVQEINLMVCAVHKEMTLEDFIATDSFHSFTTEAWTASRPSRTWSGGASGGFGEFSSQSLGGGVPLGQISQPTAALRPAMKTRPPTNTNRVSQYAWLSELLQMITDGKAVGVSKDLKTKQTATPLFTVAGFCPNSFAGMQAVVYNQVNRGVDFWWVKPQESNPQELERATMDLHISGRHTNAAGKSRAVYAPLAAKFLGIADQGDFAFGVEDGRAYVQELKGGLPKSKRRMLLYFVWQENWSSLFARRKFIEGKICYQWSEPDGSKPQARYFSRQFRIEDGQLDIAEEIYEEEVRSLLPPDSFQEMYEM